MSISIARMKKKKTEKKTEKTEKKKKCPAGNKKKARQNWGKRKWAA